MATAQVNNIIQIGGTDNSSNITTLPDNPEGFFTIVSGGGSPASGKVWPFRKNGALYQVTNGKTFVTTKVVCWTSSSSGYFQLMSATATFANDATTGSLTGPVYQSGAADRYQHITQSGTALVPQHAGVIHSFSGDSYPGVQFNSFGVTVVWVIGREI
jgi:hypothetical protein